ncbi:hypothetical protein QVD17_36078 [Tagetes erecta]|uniref:Uncharacterized protein n=1 Tax=Tagetes erecta TaxID=13708 RepID=A0AAD8JS05_TARER|nr:hypothetical protein QVD17_36078 [Tagetes erecta]
MTDNNYNNNNDDDALSLKDLQMYDQTSTRSSPRTSLTQELFDFFPILSDPTPSPTGDILFCGKLIRSLDVDQDLSHDHYNSIRVAESSSFRLHDRPIKHAMMRSVSSRRDQGDSHQILTSVKKVNMTNVVTTSKWKRRMFMFLTVPEMEMSSIKGRKAPARVVDGGVDRKKMVAGCEPVSSSIVVETTARFTPANTHSSIYKAHRFSGEMENRIANQLPEADSLPDGFVDCSAEPVISLARIRDQECGVTDYKEEKLIEVHSRPDLIVDDFQLCEGDDGSAEQTRTFPVELCAYVSCDAEKLIKTPVEHCKDEISDGLLNSVAENVERKSEHKLAASLTDGNKHAGDTCQIAEKSTEQGAKMQETHVQGTLLTQDSGTSRKVFSNNFDTSEIKRKSAKRTFKTEKEFFEFTLSYQKVISERDAAISMRDKLESLCRELQHQNKMLMDECKRVSTESQNLRLELSNKFQEAIKDVTNKLEEQRDDSLTQLKENEMLRNKLKQNESQMILTEQQHAHQLKQKTLELQIADLKIQQHEEKLVKEQSQMKTYADQVSELLATEKNLRLQLTADGEKFQQFQDALVKSNEVFKSFKQEIEKMTKSITELKKENSFLKGKTEKSDFTLVQLVEDRECMKKQLEKTKNQKEKLESLCRSLQAERKQSPAGQRSAALVPV